MVADICPTMCGSTTNGVAETVEALYEKQPSVKQDVAILKHWLIKQKHLPPVSEIQLVTFLTSCNHSLEATKSCIDAYYTIKSNAPEFFKQRDPLGDDIQAISQVVDLAALSTKSPEGYTYVFGRLKDFDVNKYVPELATKLLFLNMDAALRHNPTSPGVVVIYDMKGLQFQHMAKSNPTSLKKYMMYIQEGMPVKLKTMHIINANPISNLIMTFMKPFMSKEHHELLRFHTADDWAKFCAIVPQACLPKDYGGQDDTVEELVKRSQLRMQSYREWFLEDEERCRVDESKREGKMSASVDQLFGEQGSFKKLAID